MIACIWCEDKKRGIGKNNKIPWKIKAELKHFKENTVNHPVIMGRKTFESIGKPLPNRKNIIVSTNQNLKIDGCLVCFDLNWVLKKFLSSKEIVFVIGGKSIYDFFIPYSQKLIVSVLKKEYDCDLFMNNSFDSFKLVKSENRDEFIVNWYEKNFI